MYSSTPDPAQSRPTDSWIEISSRPSNSSLSSAAPDDIVTTGLRVQQHPDGPLRRPQTGRSPLFLNLDNDGPHSAGGGSSQDEYEESESESDQVMTSSNEGLPQQESSFTSDSLAYERDGYIDDARTALDQQCFTPQPNAFTHPPSSSSSRHRASVPGSYFPPSRPAPSSQRHSFPGNQQRQAHSPYSTVSPNHQADHDAALRASLNTLLSCAAAARSLPKKSSDTTAATSSRGVANASGGRVDTSTLRMVPESVAIGSGAGTRTEEANGHRHRRLSASSQTSTSARDASPTPSQNEKNKRKATTTHSNATRSNSKDRRLTKKPRRLNTASSSSGGAVDPTLLTWVVSAGVLVLVSALSFSAGYVTGREAGIAEASTVSGAGLREGAARGCSREVGRGLRRLRWGVSGGAAAARTVGA